MYQQIIVPLDGSDASARALRPGLRLARVSDAPLRVVGVAPGDLQIPNLRRVLDDQLAHAVALEGSTAEASVVIKHEGEPWKAIAEELDARPGSFICMSSRGRRRTATLCGSTADEVVRHVTTPLMLVGPSAEVDTFDRSRGLLVCVDGSQTSEAILPIAASWSIAFHLDLSVVTVLSPQRSEASESEDALVDSAYVHWAAEKLEADTGRAVEFDVVHARDPVRALVAHAADRKVAAIAAATHGRTGLHRVTAGSVASALVRSAQQPVLTYRPLELLR